MSEDRRTIVVRLTSFDKAPVRVRLKLLTNTMRGLDMHEAASATYVATVLSTTHSADTTNTAAEPMRVAPITYPPTSLTEPLVLPARSFAVVVVSLATVSAA